MQVSASSTLGGAAPPPFAADPDAASQQDAQEQDSAAGNGSSSLKELLPDSALSPNIALQLQAKPQQQTAQTRQATIGPPQGYLADLQGIAKSDLSVGDKLQMAWDTTKYHWRNPDTVLGGSMDDQGCIITPDNGPKICVGPAAIEGIGAKIEAGALSAAQKALSSTASKGATAVDLNIAKAAGEAAEGTAGTAAKGKATALAVKGIGTAEELGIPKFLSPRQELHIPPVSDGRSILTVDPAELLQGLHDGSFTMLRQPKSGQVVVDFGKPIGEYWSNGARVGETQFGSVSFGKNGAHIIPANPNQW